MKFKLMISTSITLVLPVLLSQERPSFEAASVKPNPQSGFSSASISIAGNSYRATGTKLRRLILEAYNVRDWQLVGGPSWVASDQWDVETVAGDGVTLLFFNVEDPSRPTAASLMMQSM